MRLDGCASIALIINLLPDVLTTPSQSLNCAEQLGNIRTRRTFLLDHAGGKRVTDEGSVFEATLMRFVDGDLPPREHAFVAGLIAAHPEASRSVLAYRFTNEELRWVYDVAMNVPAELIDRCLPAADRPNLRSRLPSWRSTALALAASLALLLVGAAGWVLREATKSDVAAFLGIAPPTHAKKERVTTPDWRTKVWSR
jgi:hypothetical protein